MILKFQMHGLDRTFHQDISTLLLVIILIVNPHYMLTFNSTSKDLVFLSTNGFKLSTYSVRFLVFLNPILLATAVLVACVTLHNLVAPLPTHHYGLILSWFSSKINRTMLRLISEALQLITKSQECAIFIFNSKAQ